MRLILNSNPFFIKSGIFLLKAKLLNTAGGWLRDSGSMEILYKKREISAIELMRQTCVGFCMLKMRGHRLFLAAAWLGVAMAASAEEAGDWRLEVLKELGMANDTPTLEKYQENQGPKLSKKQLAEKISRLSDEKFKEREQAQKEIIQIGKEVLPLLRDMPESDDPEVRHRLGVIKNSLAANGRWSKNDLLPYAVASLLRERKNEVVDEHKDRLFVEFFSQDTPSIAKGYNSLSFTTGVEVDGSVVGGFAHLKGNHQGDGDQRLLLKAKDLTGKPELPDRFHVQAKLGGEGGGVGSYHVGISIGNVRALFHPGYRTGAFRFEQVDQNQPIRTNTDMGFDPPSGKFLLMSIDAKRLPNGDVALEVLVREGKKLFRTKEVIKADIIGKLDQIGLDRSGRAGGDGIFDDLVVSWE
jgi:hypothetical protein